MDILYKTVHGSRLYGTARPDSDNDFYVVVDKPVGKRKISRQSIVDGVDTTTVDIGTWVRYCEMGVPQALEAMFADPEYAEIDRLPFYRPHFFVGTRVYDKYLDTIKSFALQDGYKQKRHSLRLAINMAEFRGKGRFQPTLTSEQKSWVSLFANMPGTHVYRLAKETAWKP